MGRHCPAGESDEKSSLSFDVVYYPGQKGKSSSFPGRLYARSSFRSHRAIHFIAATASAQLATTTSLVGNVTDPTGKSVQNAKVTAVETGTADTRSTTTNEQGYYSFEFVRVGVYSVTVEQPGFQKVTKTGIQVNINQSVRTDFTLAVGAVTQSVTVEAMATGHQDRRRHAFPKSSARARSPNCR